MLEGLLRELRGSPNNAHADVLLAVIVFIIAFYWAAFSYAYIISIYCMCRLTRMATHPVLPDNGVAAVIKFEDMTIEQKADFGAKNMMFAIATQKGAKAAMDWINSGEGEKHREQLVTMLKGMENA